MADLPADGAPAQTPHEAGLATARAIFDNPTSGQGGNASTPPATTTEPSVVPDADKGAADKTAEPKVGADGKPIEAKTGDGQIPEYDYAQHLSPEARAFAPAFEGPLAAIKDAGVSGLVAAPLVKAFEDFGTAAVLGEREQHAQRYGEMVRGWYDDTMKSVSAEDLGGARSVLPKLFDRDTIQAIEALGYTSHKGFVQAMVRLWRATRDDSWVNAGGSRDERRTDARSHFPNSGHAP